MPKGFEVNNPEQEPQDIKVDMDEWVLTQAPNFVETRPLRPCAGVIIYDPETKQALVGHFIDFINSDLPDMVSKAKELFPDLKKLQVFLGGLAHEGQYKPAQTKQRRRDFKRALLNSGFDQSQITTRWQDSDQSTVMSIDPATGKMDYDIETHRELNRDDD